MNIHVGLRTSLRPAQRIRQAWSLSVLVKPTRLSHSYFAGARNGFSSTYGRHQSTPFNTFSLSRIARYTGLSLAVFTISTFSSPPALCDAVDRETPGSLRRPPPPESIVNVYELSFGTVAGITVGIFIKKGAKAVAFIVGGIFVLLQYFNSMNLVRINWTQVSRRFENLFYTVEPDGRRRAPSITSLWNWLVDFLTADFQPRATFLAGLLLGLRVG